MVFEQILSWCPAMQSCIITNIYIYYNTKYSIIYIMYMIYYIYMCQMPLDPQVVWFRGSSHPIWGYTVQAQRIVYPPAHHIWLVALTILKNISQWEGLSQILWKIKNVWNHQPDIILHPICSNYQLYQDCECSKSIVHRQTSVHHENSPNCLLYSSIIYPSHLHLNPIACRKHPEPIIPMNCVSDWILKFPSSQMVHLCSFYHSLVIIRL
jgi:hypothetical protein